jgi:DNA-binding NarL/FixJ family response regulator
VTQLSPRQTEVVELVCEGLSNKAIATELGISHGRVRQQITAIGKKLPGTGPPRWRIMAWHFRIRSHAA